MDIINENIPIFARIAEGVKDDILSGKIKEGEQLTSTTRLSKEYNINIATVNKGINVLVNEGIVYKKRGIGMFVAEGATEKLIEERRKTFRERYVIAILEEAKRLRYSAEDLQKMVMEEYNKNNQHHIAE